MVMNSKELEDRLPTLKDAIHTIQASDESKKVEYVPDKHRHQHHGGHENSASLENDCMLLPHDRVGGDFSWLQAQSQEVSAVQKADELEDEESFLYGIGDIGGKQPNKSSTTLFAFSRIGEHAKPVEMNSPALGDLQHNQNNSLFSSLGDVVDLKQHLQMTSSSLTSVSLDSSEREKVRNILKGLGTANISEIMMKMHGQKEGKQLPPAAAAGLALPALSNPNVRQALESLQSLIKATKDKRTKGDGSGTSQTSSDTHKASDKEERKREKQARITKMESLKKELEALLKQDGLSFLTPVIGFFCQKCEEFIGDLTSAESHAAIHSHSNSSCQKVQMDKHSGDGKGLSHYLSSSNRPPRPSDKRDHRDSGYHKDSQHRNHRNYEQDWRDERDHRSKYDNDHRSLRAGPKNIFLKEDMRKERMLITVARGLAPPPNARDKEEVKKENTNGSHNKVKVEGGKGKSSMDSREKDKVKNESSDSSDDDKEKSSKTKSPKKKKKKKKKKKEKGNKS